ncbi:MAG: hypothetical protein KF773_12960 [Deltaproteobacteria bacterium]|nr:hypothetical protein [Deltaproteobacteria bacterium]
MHELQQTLLEPHQGMKSSRSVSRAFPVLPHVEGDSVHHLCAQFVVGTPSYNLCRDTGTGVVRDTIIGKALRSSGGASRSSLSRSTSEMVNPAMHTPSSCDATVSGHGAQHVGHIEQARAIEISVS